MSNSSRDDYQTLVLAGDPIGYWPLRENADDKCDHAHHDGASHGVPEFISDATGGWVRLDGKSYIEVPSNPDFSQPNSVKGLTVEVWMQAQSLHYPNANKYIHWLGKGELNHQEWAFRLYSDDGDKPCRVSAYIWNKVGHEGAGAHLKSRILSNEWMHLVACFQPGNAGKIDRGVLIYRNGEFQQGPPAPTTLYEHSPRWCIYPSAGDAPLRFGTRSDPSTSHPPNCLVGGLAEIAIYQRGLDGSEIASHYEVGSMCFV
jgi:hypothetical protein